MRYFSYQSGELLMEKIYVIGHLNPDTDSVVSAITMASFLNKITNSDTYVAAMAGSANSETEFIFNKFNAKLPEILENGEGKKVFLVDHNEETQRVSGIQNENILGFVDHHKIAFTNPGPIDIITKPWGCTNSIIYDMFKKENIEIPNDLKPLILCAILSDTVILKSVTCTDIDKKIAQEIAQELNIDYKELGMDLFKAKAKVAEKSAEEIIKNDYKDFDFSGKKVGIGQIETPDLNEIEPKIPEILEKMKSLKESENYDSIVLMLTDIIEEGSKLLIVSNNSEKIAGIFETNIENNISGFLAGVMSRKKQVAKKLAEKY